MQIIPLGFVTCARKPQRTKKVNKFAENSKFTLPATVPVKLVENFDTADFHWEQVRQICQTVTRTIHTLV